MEKKVTRMMKSVMKSLGEGHSDQPQNQNQRALQPQGRKGSGKSLVALHNSLHVKGVSLYGIGYGKVHPENANEATANRDSQTGPIHGVDY
ncbi:hypothetical protein FOB22_002931 [Saccharomyces cerevisiae]|nr:hypothetical protein FOB22_002931 [Saccharomyces cerevisiae]